MRLNNENLISNILIRNNVISNSGIDFLINYAKNGEKIDTFVGFDENRTVNKEVRKAKSLVSIDQETIQKIHELLKKIVDNIINPYYRVEVFDGELPQFLVYEVGDYYIPHCDVPDKWYGENNQESENNRDLSCILYLNDDFEGGDLFFPELSITIKPKKGMLVVFPSNYQYLHGVSPVTKGTRYAIVTWVAIKRDNI